MKRADIRLDDFRRECERRGLGAAVRESAGIGMDVAASSTIWNFLIGDTGAGKVSCCLHRSLLQLVQNVRMVIFAFVESKTVRDPFIMIKKFPYV